MSGSDYKVIFLSLLWISFAYLLVSTACMVVCVIAYLHVKEELEYQREDQIIEERAREISDDEVPKHLPKKKWKINPSCEKKEQNIAFIKTHKTGGSTITSVFNRFADITELEIALPGRQTRFGWPGPFKHTMVDRTRLKYKKANFLTNHLVLREKELHKIMHGGFRLITIVRDPVDRFYSMFHYADFAKVYRLQNAPNPVSKFLSNISLYYHRAYSRKDSELHFKEMLLRNGMAFDLNAAEYKRDHKNASFKHFIDYMDSIFDFVLVNDLFDEGLLILRKLLCWNLMDVVYSKKLVNRKLKKEKKPTEKMKDTIHRWSADDLMIYKFFRRKMEKLIAEQPQEKFQDELFKFRVLNQMVGRYCRNQTRSNFKEIADYLYEIRETEGSDEFATRPECFCKKMARSEVQYIEYFRTKFPNFYFYKTLRRKKRIWKGC